MAGDDRPGQDPQSGKGRARIDAVVGRVDCKWSQILVLAVWAVVFVELVGHVEE